MAALWIFSFRGFVESCFIRGACRSVAARSEKEKRIVLKRLIISRLEKWVFGLFGCGSNIKWTGSSFIYHHSRLHLTFRTLSSKKLSWKLDFFLKHLPSSLNLRPGLVFRHKRTQRFADFAQFQAFPTIRNLTKEFSVHPATFRMWTHQGQKYLIRWVVVI